MARSYKTSSDSHSNMMMKRGFLFFILALFVIFLVWPSASAALPKLPAKDLPSTALSPALMVKTPAAGENWALGKASMTLPGPVQTSPGI